MSALRVTYRKSQIGYAKDQKATLKALGSSQEEVDDSMLTAISRFLREALNQSS